MSKHGDHLIRHVIIAGYGVVGRVVAELFIESNIDVTVIELNQTTCDRQEKLDRRVVFGDATDSAVLTDAGIKEAQALILALPDENQVVTACEVARALNPDIYIAARTNFVSKGMHAKVAGADCVIVEEIVTAEAMKRTVMQEFLGSDSGD